MKKSGESLLSFAASRAFTVLGVVAALTSPAGATAVVLTDDASLPGPAREGASPGSMASLRVGGEARSIALVKFDLESLPDGLAGSSAPSP